MDNDLLYIILFAKRIYTPYSCTTSASIANDFPNELWLLYTTCNLQSHFIVEANEITVQWFEVLQNFLGRKQLHHFYCQTKRMFTWELTAALADKSKDTQVVSLPIPSGDCLQAPLFIIHQLNLCCGWGTSLKATLYVQHRAAQHGPGPGRQVNWHVDRRLLQVQCSSGQDCYSMLLHWVFI